MPLRIKVVIVTTWEPSASRDWLPGDPHGELREWIERERLHTRLPFPAGPCDLRLNATEDVLAVVTGVSLAQAAASVLALGLDPRFDFTHSYWLLNGLAGVDPLRGTIGSVAWASFVVGNTGRALDAREMPAAWPYGSFALGTTGPGTIPAQPMVENNYPLNAHLARWAFLQTQDLQLAENVAMQQSRAAWTANFPLALAPPSVLQGDIFAGDTYWHGVALTDAARDWVRLWTRGEGTFAMTAMEDSGVAEALLRLHRLQRADRSRLLILRAASNFCRQAPGHEAVESLTAPFIRSTALYNAWLAGSTVVHALLADWQHYEAQTPQP